MGRVRARPASFKGRRSRTRGRSQCVLVKIWRSAWKRYLPQGRPQHIRTVRTCVPFCSVLLPFTILFCIITFDSSYCNCPVYCESCAESFFQGQLRRMPRPALVSFPGESLCGTWERDQPGAARPQPMPCPAGRPRPYNIISRDRTRGLSRVRLCHCTNYTVYSCQPGQGS